MYKKKDNKELHSCHTVREGSLMPRNREAWEARMKAAASLRQPQRVLGPPASRRKLVGGEEGATGLGTKTCHHCPHPHPVPQHKNTAIRFEGCRRRQPEGQGGPNRNTCCLSHMPGETPCWDTATPFPGQPSRCCHFSPAGGRMCFNEVTLSLVFRKCLGRRPSCFGGRGRSCHHQPCLHFRVNKGRSHHEMSMRLSSY